MTEQLYEKELSREPRSKLVSIMLQLLSFGHLLLFFLFMYCFYNLKTIMAVSLLYVL